MVSLFHAWVVESGCLSCVPSDLRGAAPAVADLEAGVGWQQDAILVPSGDQVPLSPSAFSGSTLSPVPSGRMVARWALRALQEAAGHASFERARRRRCPAVGRRRFRTQQPRGSNAKTGMKTFTRRPFIS